jgi:hypothetical protein
MPEKKWRKTKCDGGTEVEVLEHAHKFGVSYEKIYYRNFTGKPEGNCLNSIFFNIHGFGRVKPYDIPQLKAVLGKTPVTAVINSEVI